MTALNSCGLSGLHDFVQTGIVEMVALEASRPALSSSVPTSSQCKTLPIDFPVTMRSLDYALSFNSYYDFRLGHRGAEILLNGRLINSEFQITLFISGPDWTIVTVAYLLSARGDLFIGSFYVDLLDCQGEDQASGWSVVAKWRPKPASDILVEAVFLSGIRTLDPSNLTVSFSSLFDSRTGNLTVVVQGARNVQYVKVSYVIATRGICLHGETPLVGVVESTPDLLQQYDRVFNGSRGLANSQPALKAIGFQSDSLLCEGERCAGSCISSQDCSHAQGVVVGKTCKLCDSANQQWDQLLKICRCSDNAVIAPDGRCILCGPHSSPIDFRCQCDEGFALGVYGCMPKCTPGSHYDYASHACLCDDPRLALNVHNICTCGPPCDCNVTSFYDGSACVECPPNSTPTSTGCTCQNQLESWNSASHQCVLTCGTGAVLELVPFPKCACAILGSTLQPDNSCRCPSLFSPSQTSPSVCVCDSSVGFLSSNGTCLAYPLCTNGMVFNPTTLNCSCSNPQQTYNGLTCVCPPNQLPSADNSGCQCVAGYYSSASGCSICWANAFFDGKACLCSAGYYLSAPKTCSPQPNCVNGALFDSVSQSCVCQIASQTPFATGCACPPPSSLNANNECVCEVALSAVAIANKCACLVSDYAYQSGVGCTSSSVATSVSVRFTGSLLASNALYAGFCLGIFAASGDSAYDLRAQVTQPSSYQPTVLVQLSRRTSGCFVVIFSGAPPPSLFTTSISVQTIRNGVGGAWIQGPFFQIDLAHASTVTSGGTQGTLPASPSTEDLLTYFSSMFS